MRGSRDSQEPGPEIRDKTEPGEPSTDNSARFQINGIDSLGLTAKQTY